MKAANNPSDTAMNHPITDILTKRQLQCVQLWAQGLTNEEIAEQLSITEHTVRSHTATVYHKLGVSSKLELRIALERDGLMTDQLPRAHGIDDIARFLATLHVARRRNTWQEAAAVIDRQWNDPKFRGFRRAYTDDARHLVMWLGIQPSSSQTGT